MNKVILVGNLTADPELTRTPNDVAVCRFTLAIQRRFANQNGERQADFIPIVVWRQAAENCGKYLKKGSRAGVSGSIQTRSYDAQDGTKRYVTEVIADEVEFLSTPRDSSTGESSFDEKAETKIRKISELTPADENDLPF